MARLNEDRASIARLVTEFANAFQGTDDIVWLDRAARIVERPSDPLSWYGLAELCRERGHIELWRRAVSIAFGLDHITYHQLVERAFARLTLGDWRGWSDYEARHFAPTLYRSRYSRRLRWMRPAWSGAEDLSDKVILVLHEQGFGDTIQMLRYVPVVAQRARHVILVLQPELVDLAQHNFGTRVSTTIRGPEFPLECDYYVRLMSLPALLGELPRFAPFSTLPVRARSADKDGPFHAGVCWAGDPKHPRDSIRSMSLSTLASVLQREDVCWHSLQVGDRESEAKLCSMLLIPDPPLRSFADSARLIASLDFVVTVDTAISHLAGSLGVPTFLILPYASEWRWGLGDNTPWYPTMRLIRQPKPGAWDAVVATLVSYLNESPTNLGKITHCFDVDPSGP